jgi:hypothetical protein
MRRNRDRVHAGASERGRRSSMLRSP